MYLKFPSEISLSWGLLILSSLFSAVAILLVKRRFNHLGVMEVFPIRRFLTYLLEYLKAPAVWLAAFLILISPLLWFVSLKKMELGVSYPAAYAVNLFFIFIFSALFLREKLSWNKLAGALFLLIGFFLFYNI